MDGIRQVTPTLWRGPRPQSQADVQALQALGVLQVVNLQSDVIEGLQVEQEKAWVTGENIEFFHQPMSLITPPAKEQVSSVLVLLGLVPTYLHCHDGVDRTGVCCAALRVKGGATFGAAIGEMIDDGFHLDWYALWLPEIQKWAT